MCSLDVTQRRTRENLGARLTVALATGQSRAVRGELEKRICGSPDAIVVGVTVIELEMGERLFCDRGVEDSHVREGLFYNE